MSATVSRPKFPAPFSESLTRLSDCIESLTRQHGTSFISAGADRVYALGDGEHVIVFDEKKWQGLIEVYTPKGMISIKPSEDGSVSVSSGEMDDPTMSGLIAQCCDEVEAYYKKRYWTTPKSVA